MKVIFEAKDFRVPNFLKTNIGTVDIKNLDKGELEDLKITYGYALEDNWRRRKFASQEKAE